MAIEDQALRTRLEALAHTLRPLHKALLETERREWERANGPVQNPVQLFHLVTKDPQFSWLRPLSGLMAEIDALIDEKEPVAPEQVQQKRATLESYLAAPTDGSEPHPFAARYLGILQEHPAIVLLHSRVRRALTEL